MPRGLWYMGEQLSFIYAHILPLVFYGHLIAPQVTANIPQVLNEIVFSYVFLFLFREVFSFSSHFNPHKKD